MSITGLVYNLGRVTQLASPHRDTYTHIHHPNTCSSQQLSQLLRCAPDMCPLHTHYIIFVMRLHIDLWLYIIECLT
jgi:hypothetical protein